MHLFKLNERDRHFLFAMTSLVLFRSNEVPFSECVTAEVVQEFEQEMQLNLTENVKFVLII